MLLLCACRGDVAASYVIVLILELAGVLCDPQFHILYLCYFMHV